MIKKRLISMPEELDKLLQELSEKMGYTVNAVILQQLWKLKEDVLKALEG